MDLGISALIAMGVMSAIAVPPAAPGASAGQISVQRFGLYVLVDDVERSVAFYAALFGKEPQLRTPALVGFDVSGGLFGIVSRSAFAPGSPPGGSVRPYIKVSDLAAAYERVRTLAPEGIDGEGIVREGPFSFFRFADPDGNIVEFFSVSPQD